MLPSNSLLTGQRWSFSCGSVAVSVACFWCQGFGDVSPYVCSYYFTK